VKIIIAAAALQHIISLTTIQRIIAGFGNKEWCIPKKNIITSFTVQMIVSYIPDQLIASFTTKQLILSRTRPQLIVTVLTL
jgi:hypothetical protein